MIARIGSFFCPGPRIFFSVGVEMIGGGGDGDGGFRLFVDRGCGVLEMTTFWSLLKPQRLRRLGCQFDGYSFIPRKWKTNRVSPPVK